ncbi:putative bifunctional diguanylate cyclase/phosphodiesterase [Pararhizobium mangrovi]|uniref:EAL domain-containing protein n=1 Tax=Pararhizobium mangrovi TaxID=2590452 RepID=A0A506TWX6_9HYPH|nr:EAL domain-containing protein [Pararhizobium mangrovi]TPW26542.1 EAL domain-containing protein [Pararhizobium mangrovi]
MDDIIELARSVFHIENISLSILYAEQQICHVESGTLNGDLPRPETFCQTTIQSDAVVIAEDARTDARFKDLPRVSGDAGIRFYAGAPLITPEGHRLGALCLLDTEPRVLNDRQLADLKRLAGLAMEHMNLVRAREEARYDALTGLLTRRSLIERMDAAIAAERRSAALLIDLDGFKDVNDSLGHAYGDLVLQTVVERLGRFKAEGRTVARLGGDEFVLFLDGAVDLFEAAGLADRILRALAEPIVINGHLVHVGGSIGLVVRTNEANALDLLGNADLAMYQAKLGGRGCYRMFEQTMRHNALERGNAILELQEAWEEGALELYYQPLVRLADGAWAGAEALLRWNYPYRGVLPPAVFLPVLERSHLAVPVGSWIIREACRQAAAWRKTYDPDFHVAVNLFEVQFRTGDLIKVVTGALAEHGLPTSALKLEITENILLTSDPGIVEQLHALKALGVGIAFDDFGTGFASLSALKDYPVTSLKIDKSFIANVTESEMDLSIVDALLHIAETFKLSVVAEGIEEEAQRDLIRGRLCEYAQGYLYNRPTTALSFEEAWTSQLQTRARG